MTSKAAQKIADRDAARASLRELFPIGSTVSTKLLHVSKSGMLRSVAVLHGEADGTVTDVSGLVARATDSKLHQPTGGVAMGGVGMDMGFALVYSLARSLYSSKGSEDPEGRPPFFCTGTGGYASHDATDAPRCPSNDHVNERMSESDYSTTRVHSDSGYALNHRWI